MLTREAIAYEEAGHAAIAIMLSRPISGLEISAYKGRVYAKGKKTFERRDFIIALAGPIARLRFDPDSSGIDDIAQVKGLVTAADYEALDLRAKELVESCWAEIECVAKAALNSETGRLSEAEILAAMESASAW